jgi:hypothetical protein
VLTTTHLPHLNELAGQDTGAIEIVGKPYDLKAIVGTVRFAIEDRGRSSARIISHKRE